MQCKWRNRKGYNRILAPFSLLAIPLAALLLAAPPLTAPPPGLPVRALLDRVVEAYGGRAALEKHPVMVQEGEVSAHESSDVGRVTRIFERPRRLRVSISYPGSTPERRILDGPQAWRDRREVTGTPPHLAMVLQAARMDLPFVLSEAAARVTDEGTIERDGRRLRILSLPLGDGATVSAEIDEPSGRIHRAVGRMPAGPGSLEFVTTFSDFRKVSGTWVAFREESFVHGRHSGTTGLTSVEFLEEAPTGAFRP
jgi:hypothetical protein